MVSRLMAADQFGHAGMALIAAVLLLAAGVQLWLLRQATDHGGGRSVWRAAAWRKRSADWPC